MHAWRACRTAFRATAAGAFSCVLRNSLGTWNVPNFACRAKTLWSCRRSETRGLKLFYIWDGKMQRCVEGARYVWKGWKIVRRDGQGGAGEGTGYGLVIGAPARFVC